MADQVVNLELAGLLGEVTNSLPLLNIWNVGFGDNAPERPRIAAP